MSFEDLDLEHEGGSGVPRFKSRNSLVSENCPGQDLSRPEDGYAVGKNPTYALTGSFRLECIGTGKLLPWKLVGEGDIECNNN